MWQSNEAQKFYSLQHNTIAAHKKILSDLKRNSSTQSALGSVFTTHLCSFSEL